MKAINNKKGSAILWTILLTVIITILLGAVMTASYAYFNYTMYTVRKQQAYFTARSAMDSLIDEFSSQEQDVDSEDEMDIPILPAKNTSIDISEFNFDSSMNMGKATATISRDDGDEVEVKVTAEYLDQTYTMKSTIVKHPLYFAGVAINNLNLQGNLNLGKNTDLYYYNDDTVNPANRTFNTAVNGYTININGNLVTKHDAVISAGTTVAGHKFKKSVFFSQSSSRYSRQIWSPTEYIISNKTLVVGSDRKPYESGRVNDFTSLPQTTVKYCNNIGVFKDQYFGFPTLADATIVKDALKLLGLSNVVTDIENDNMKLESQGENSLAIRYIKLLSLSKLIDDTVNSIADSSGFFGKIAQLGYSAVNDFVKKYGFTVLDVSYIEFNATNISNYGDNVIPVVYLFVTGSETADTGLTVRVKYGNEPYKESYIGKGIDNFQNSISDFITERFDIKNKPSYVIVQLGKNATIELGTTVGGRNNNSDDLVFCYSIYGEPGSKVILNDGVTLLGEVVCDKLEIKDSPTTAHKGVNIIYTTSNGSQVAKQKVAQYWAVVNYSD